MVLLSMLLRPSTGTAVSGAIVFYNPLFTISTKPLPYNSPKQLL